MKGWTKIDCASAVTQIEVPCDEIEETLGDEKANTALVKTVSQEFDRYAKVKKNIFKGKK